MKYRILMLHSTDPKKLNKNEGPSKLNLTQKCHRRQTEGGKWVGKGMGRFRIRCGERQGRRPDSHKNEWKSATNWGGDKGGS